MKKIVLEPRFDVSPPTAEGHIAAFDVGPDERLYVAFALKEADTRLTHPSGASFYKTKPDEGQSYQVKWWRHDELAGEVLIPHDPFNLTMVQPLGKDLLLVCPRCMRKSDEEVERNARVFDRQGQLVRDFVLGDGIEHVQVSRDGTIWTGYFDEGIFGNYGWDEPLGASGLVGWSATGEKLSEFQPSAGLDEMADCYAMIVDRRGDVWCCYYTDFPLVRLRNGGVQEIWRVPVEGSRGLAIDPPHALFLDRYGSPGELCLVELLANERAKKVGTFLACSPDGEPLSFDHVACRDRSIHLISGNQVYSLDVATCLSTSRRS